MLTPDLDLEQLVRRHGARLLSLARALLRDEAESRSAVREAFLAASPAAANGSAWPALGASLARAASRRRPASPEPADLRIESLLPRFDAAGRRIASPRSGVPSEASNASAAPFLIRRLPWDHRAALVLCDGGGLRPEEAATALGERPEVVRRRLGEAHQALCTLLATSPGPRCAAPEAPPPR